MPRMGRVVLAGYAHHIVQRGHNRQPMFAEARDYRRYLDRWKEFKEGYAIEVYVFCLMTNHVHLLLSRSDCAGIGKLMKPLAGRQTRNHNRLEGRSGTLWEGRYKSSVVQTEAYLLACCRYIELNPVRARMVSEPERYPWSSCRYRFGDEGGDWLDYDACYLALGQGDEERKARYEAFLHSAILDGEWPLVRDAVQRGQLTGSDRFTEEVAAIIRKGIERRGKAAQEKVTSGLKKDLSFCSTFFDDGQ